MYHWSNKIAPNDSSGGPSGIKPSQSSHKNGGNENDFPNIGGNPRIRNLPKFISNYGYQRIPWHRRVHFDKDFEIRLSIRANCEIVAVTHGLIQPLIPWYVDRFATTKRTGPESLIQWKIFFEMRIYAVDRSGFSKLQRNFKGRMLLVCPRTSRLVRHLGSLKKLNWLAQ